MACFCLMFITCFKSQNLSANIWDTYKNSIHYDKEKMDFQKNLAYIKHYFPCVDFRAYIKPLQESGNPSKREKRVYVCLCMHCSVGSQAGELERSFCVYL